MKYEYTNSDYLASIDRELAKRAVTYPKILQKMIKNDVDFHLYDNEIAKQSGQVRKLRNARHLFESFIDCAQEFKQECFDELLREYKMRRKCYARFVMFKRMTQDEAMYEKYLWRELTIYFAETYLGNAQLAIDAMETKKCRLKIPDS